MRRTKSCSGFVLVLAYSNCSRPPCSHPIASSVSHYYAASVAAEHSVGGCCADAVRWLLVDDGRWSEGRRPVVVVQRQTVLSLCRAALLQFRWRLSSPCVATRLSVQLYVCGNRLTVGAVVVFAAAVDCWSGGVLGASAVCWWLELPIGTGDLGGPRVDRCGALSVLPGGFRLVVSRSSTSLVAGAGPPWRLAWRCAAVRPCVVGRCGCLLSWCRRRGRLSSVTVQ